MKFIHIADLHLGKSMFDYPLLQDQKAVLEQVIGYAAQYEVDAVVAAGDLYDKPVPPAEAVTVLDGFMTRLSEMGIPLLMVSGNHDSPERLDFGSALLSGRGVYLAGAFNGLPRKVTLGKEGGRRPTSTSSRLSGRGTSGPATRGRKSAAMTTRSGW